MSQNWHWINVHNNYIIILFITADNWLQQGYCAVFYNISYVYLMCAKHRRAGYPGYGALYIIL